MVLALVSAMVRMAVLAYLLVGTFLRYLTFAVWETGVSRHQGGQIEGHPETPRTSLLLALVSAIVHMVVLAYLLIGTLLPFGWYLPTFWLVLAYLLFGTCLPFGWYLPTFWLVLSYLLVGTFLPFGWYFPEVLALVSAMYHDRAAAGRELVLQFATRVWPTRKCGLGTRMVGGWEGSSVGERGVLRWGLGGHFWRGNNNNKIYRQLSDLYSF